MPVRGARRAAWRRWLAYILAAAGAFYLFCAASLVLLRWVDPPTTAVHIQRRLEAALSARPYRKQYRFVPLSGISPHLRHAVVAAEDARFLHHHGVDWIELRKIIEEEWERGRFRGGSTITQQLIKNLFLTTRGSVVRKAYEFALAPVAELALPKRRILELYLNVIEWGPGVYGAEAAARYYYRVPAARLNREQAARLAAVLPAPLRRRPGRMHERSAEILERMAQMGW
ncbi:MAG: monofunctional biosynthetic peptidoglycan transglycosylase [Bryobacterales bacterium]|nr:monofunctional biosynthetic peptidoglycan transglycosylase [Bryobacteraceae bacterium]MDW8354978.1 monofunctional biosynthetic peptidoglycan transglycosylase [Bryobacterales bacterium]